MPSYKAPLEDVSFLLNDVFQIDRYDNLPGFVSADASADVRGGDAARSREVQRSRPAAAQSRRRYRRLHRHDDGSVTTPKGFKEAYQQVAEGGWLGFRRRPNMAGRACRSTLTRRQRIPVFGQHGLFHVSGADHGATAALMVHGKPEQKTNVRAEDGGGRMDRHHESDRAAMRHGSRPVAHQAVKQADGSYKITGTKIFISAGEHDLAENIIHLVLARIEGAPAGTRASRCSWCRRSWSMRRRLARRAQRRVLRLDRSTRWAFTAIRPA
jgi:acyl-CoA dehydrogenase